MELPASGDIVAVSRICPSSPTVVAEVVPVVDPNAIDPPAIRSSVWLKTRAMLRLSPFEKSLQALIRAKIPFCVHPSVT
jgi:hypothetical protein